MRTHLLREAVLRGPALVLEPALCLAIETGKPAAAALAEVPDGPPMRFTWRGQTYGIARWEGPERIAAEWWHRRDRGGRPRDYYRVEEADGHRFWLFRPGLHDPGGTVPAWYIHGLFA